MLVQVVNLLLAAQSHVAGQGDDFHTRCHDKEGHVETHLVVAGSGRTVGDGIGSDFVGIAGDGQCLEDALRADGDGVGAVTQHVAVDHVFQTLFVVFAGDVQCHVFHGAQLVGVLFVGFQLLGTESAGVGAGSIYFVSFFLGQIHHSERSVQPAAECDNYFFLLCFHNYCIKNEELRMKNGFVALLSLFFIAVFALFVVSLSNESCVLNLKMHHSSFFILYLCQILSSSCSAGL